MPPSTFTQINCAPFVEFVSLDIPLLRWDYKMPSIQKDNIKLYGLVRGVNNNLGDSNTISLRLSDNLPGKQALTLFSAFSQRRPFIVGGHFAPVKQLHSCDAGSFCSREQSQGLMSL